METRYFTAAVLAGLTLVSAPAQADGRTQLIAAAGLTPAEAADMSLTEIYARKINNESGRDGQVTVSSRGLPKFRAEEHRQLVRSAGLTEEAARAMDLATVAAHKASRGATRDDRIPAPRSVATGFDATAHPQLLASAGVAPDEADGLSLSEIYRRKQNREAGRDGQQSAPR